MPERNIADYFDLPYQENEHMSITLKKHPKKPENCVLLTIKFSVKKSMENISTLPIELLHIIYSYVSYEYIQLTFMISFPVDYPFTPPTWSLEDEKNNLSYSALNHTTIRDYFQELTFVHNEQYRRSPKYTKYASRNGSNAEVSASYSEGRRRSPEEYEEEEISQMSDLQRKRRFDYYYWTPAITIEKDILCFIKRINHFQYILQPDFP